MKWILLAIVPISLVIASLAEENEPPKKPNPDVKTSYMPVLDTESFSAVRNRMMEAKPGVEKPVQKGVRVKLLPV